MSTKNSDFIKYSLFILLQCFLWGTGNPLIKLATETMPPFMCIALRYLVAALCFYIFFRKKIFKNLDRSMIKPLALISGLTAVTYIVAQFSFMFSTASSIGFLVSIAVIFSPFFAYFFNKIRINGFTVIPIVTLVVGLYLLCSQSGGFSMGIGEILALSASAAFAATIAFTSKYISKCEPMQISFFQCFVSGISALVISLICEDITLFPVYMDAQNIVIILYIGIGSAFFTSILQNISLKHISEVHASIIYASEPIFTAIFSFIILNEVLMPVGLLGGAIIILSIVIACLFQYKFPGKPVQSLKKIKNV